MDIIKAMEVTFLQSNRTTNGSIDLYGGLDAESLIYVQVYDKQHSDVAESLEKYVLQAEIDGALAKEQEAFAAPVTAPLGDAQTYRLDCLVKAIKKYDTDTWLSSDIREELLMYAFLLGQAQKARK